MTHANEELTHYGVKGMKWGVRKKTELGRVRGALLDQNQRDTAVLTRAREGRSKGIGEKYSRGVGIVLSGGKKRYNKNADRMLTGLAEQKKRLEHGKLKAGDVLQFAGRTSILELGVSIRDNKG